MKNKSTKTPIVPKITGIGAFSFSPTTPIKPKNGMHSIWVWRSINGGPHLSFAMPTVLKKSTTYNGVPFPKEAITSPLPKNPL